MSKTPISGKGTEGFTQCASVARTMHDLDAITRTYVSLGDDPEVCAGSAGMSEAADHVGHFPETSERSARNARAADLKTALPIAHRSPMTAPVWSRPSVVRFSPN